MSGIHFLGNDDFIVKQGDKGLILSLVYESKGMTLVLFYSTECPYCDALINKFKQLPSYVNGCQFAMVNVNRNMSIVERSKNTIAPISYVPDVILYINGSPYVRYDGPHDIQHIKDFIVDINKNLTVEKKTAFMDLEDNKASSSSNDYNYVTKEQVNANEGYQQQQQPQMQQQQQNLTPYQQQQQQMQQQNVDFQFQEKNQAPKPIPAYTIGTPLYGERKKEKVCYLNFNSAYVSTN
jgi:thioredoxin-like negative regulator of GroEL